MGQWGMSRAHTWVTPHLLPHSCTTGPGSVSDMQGAALTRVSVLLPQWLLGCQAALPGPLLPEPSRGTRGTHLVNKYRGGRAGFSPNPTCLQVTEVKHLDAQRSLKCLALQTRGAWGRVGGSPPPREAALILRHLYGDHVCKGTKEENTQAYFLLPASVSPPLSEICHSYGSAL